MADPTPSDGVKQPGDVNKKNEDDANEANRRTIANVQKKQSDREKSDPEFGPNS